MKAARLALLALACALPVAASAQWMWLEKDGRKVFSDKAPPPDIPAERVLKAPKGVKLAVPAPAEGGDAVAAAAPGADAANAPSLPRPAGKDKTLEDRRKQAVAAEAEKKKAEDAKYAALRAENCSRAKQAKATYDSGARIARVDASGQRQYLDDNQRADELKRLQEVIARDCV